MKKVLWCTNIPAPYSVDFYNELGQYCNLTVVYELKSSRERNPLWQGEGANRFKEVFLDLKPFGVDTALGAGLKEYIKNNSSDLLVFANYASPAAIQSILWCRLHGRKYIIDWDGGFYKEESFLKKFFKKLILGGADKYLISTEELNRYLLSLNIPQEKIFTYPFTSIREKDIVGKEGVTNVSLSQLKESLGISEKKVVLSVGRFSYDRGYGKGYDLLMRVAKQCAKDIGFYIVGDEPTEEFVKMKMDMNLENVHFVGFKTKVELSDYYKVADLFILLSRGDIWGLVINEAMSFGLPIISSDKCVAGLELVKDGKNGFIVGLSDVSFISKRVQIILDDETLRNEMGKNSLEVIRGYTIESMAKRNAQILGIA